LFLGEIKKKGPPPGWENLGEKGREGDSITSRRPRQTGQPEPNLAQKKRVGIEAPKNASEDCVGRIKPPEEEGRPTPNKSENDEKEDVGGRPKKKARQIGKGRKLRRRSSRRAPVAA